MSDILNFRRRIKTTAILLIVAAAIGAGYAALLDQIIRSDLSINSFVRGALRGLIIGSIVLGFEYSLTLSRLGKLLRRSPFLVSVIIHTVASSIVLMGAIVLSRTVLSRRQHSLEQWLEIGFLRDLAVIGFVVFLIHFTRQIIQIVGGKTLIYFLLGRYNKPVVEQRIFMLIDIVGSTAIAQKLGDARAHELITQFFFDIAAPIYMFDGETDIYVGDEIVVSWPMSSRTINARCLLCYASILDTIAKNQDRYKSEFGEAIQIRVGIHGGSIAAGECGDHKRQVVFIGDTINTAKRLQEACKDYQKQMLISQDMLDEIEQPIDFKSEKIGTMTLRGRQSETQIYSINIEPGKKLGEMTEMF